MITLAEFLLLVAFLGFVGIVLVVFGQETGEWMKGAWAQWKREYRTHSEASRTTWADWKREFDRQQAEARQRAGRET